MVARTPDRLELLSDGSLVVKRWFLPRVQVGPIQSAKIIAKREISWWGYQYDYTFVGDNRVLVELPSESVIVVAPEDVPGFLDAVRNIKNP